MEGLHEYRTRTTLSRLLPLPPPYTRDTEEGPVGVASYLLDVVSLAGPNTGGGGPPRVTGVPNDTKAGVEVLSPFSPTSLSQRTPIH